MKMLRNISRLIADTRGTAAAETVLIMPLATFILFATLEAGHFLYTEHQVIKSVRDAARYAARMPFSAFNCTAESPGDVTLPTDASALGTIRSNVSKIARYGRLTDSGVPRLVSSWDDSEITVKYRCIDVNKGVYQTANRYAPQVTVEARPNYPSLFGAMAGFPASRVLFARQQAMVIGI